MYSLYTFDGQFIKMNVNFPRDFTGICVNQDDGTKEWLVDGADHREDGPAVIWKDGTKFWCINDRNHRLDGPAIEYASGSKYWYIHGCKCTEQQHKLYVDLLRLKNISLKHY
jgi:hypothetical protein